MWSLSDEQIQVGLHVPLFSFFVRLDYIHTHTDIEDFLFNRTPFLPRKKKSHPQENLHIVYFERE